MTYPPLRQEEELTFCRACLAHTIYSSDSLNLESMVNNALHEEYPGRAGDVETSVFSLTG